MKVLTVPGKGKIVGEHAAELITTYISAMRNDYGMNRILNTIHFYPTLTEPAGSRPVSGGRRIPCVACSD